MFAKGLREDTGFGDGSDTAEGITRLIINSLEKKLTARLDVHEAAIVQVLREVMQILNPPPPAPEPPHRRIGFHQSQSTPTSDF